MTENTYAGLSKDELRLISRIEFENKKAITSEFVRDTVGSLNKATQLLNTLTKKGRLIQIQRGLYFLIPIKAPNQSWMPNEFVMASLWMVGIPYYISYFTMYHYWRFTDQVPQTIFISNTKKNKSKKIGNTHYKAMRIDEKKLFGIQKIVLDDVPVFISDKERTLVDLLYKPIGTFQTTQDIFRNQFTTINQKKFIDYLIRFPNETTQKRAGFLLDLIGCEKKLIHKLKSHITQNESYVTLDPNNKSRKGPVNKEWKIIDNT